MYLLPLSIRLEKRGKGCKEMMSADRRIHLMIHLNSAGQIIITNSAGQIIITIENQAMNSLMGIFRKLMIADTLTTTTLHSQKTPSSIFFQA